MKEFITYDMLLVYATFIGVLFYIVEFIKELKVFKGLKTKYLAFIIGCLMIMLVYTYSYVGNLLSTNYLLYMLLKLPLILINAIMATFAANGISDFNNPVDKTKKQL